MTWDKALGKVFWTLMEVLLRSSTSAAEYCITAGRFQKTSSDRLPRRLLYCLTGIGTTGHLRHVIEASSSRPGLHLAFLKSQFKGALRWTSSAKVAFTCFRGSGTAAFVPGVSALKDVTGTRRTTADSPLRRIHEWPTLGAASYQATPRTGTSRPFGRRRRTSSTRCACRTTADDFTAAITPSPSDAQSPSTPPVLATRTGTRSLQRLKRTRTKVGPCQFRPAPQARGPATFLYHGGANRKYSTARPMSERPSSCPFDGYSTYEGGRA